MYKTCSKCGRIHDFNHRCYINRQQNRGKTNADKLRKTNRWHQKSKEIRERDNGLCKVCLANLYNTSKRINADNIEVHHIVSLEENLELAFDDDNLISLCCYHHKLADKGVIPRTILYKLLEKDCDYYKVDSLVGGR